MFKNIKKVLIISAICVTLITAISVVVANNLPTQTHYPVRNLSIKNVSVSVSTTPNLSANAGGANKIEYSALPDNSPAESSVSTLDDGTKKYISIPTGYNVIAPLQNGLPFSSFFQVGVNASLNKAAAFLSVDNALHIGEVVFKQDTTKILSETVANGVSSFSNGYPYWKRTYYSMTDSQIVTVNGADYVIGVTHGENKNEAITLNGATYKYKNTIFPDTNYTDNQYSGIVNGTYADYPQAYFSFVGLISAPVSALQNSERLDTSYDKGPIIWPSTGYLLTDGNRTFTGGIRHPSMLVDGANIYVFYIENNEVKVARAPVSSLGDPSSFQMYRNGVFRASTLPTGFDKESRSFFSKGTLPSTSILGTSYSISFSVSKTTNVLNGKTYYIGVEEYYTNPTDNKVGVRIRTSTNLVDWSNPTDIYSGADYSTASLHYAKIYNSDFSRRDLIDLSNFNIVASYGSDKSCPQTTYINVNATLN